jgi:hypothetical protein
VQHRHVVPVDEFVRPAIAETLFDPAARAPQDRSRFDRIISADPARDFAALRVRMLRQEPRSNSPATATIPAGSRLLPAASAAAAPSSIVMLPAGASVPAIHCL